jgi:hypothetical protein
VQASWGQYKGAAGAGRTVAAGAVDDVVGSLHGAARHQDVGGGGGAWAGEAGGARRRGWEGVEAGGAWGRGWQGSQDCWAINACRGSPGLEKLPGSGGLTRRRSRRPPSTSTRAEPPVAGTRPPPPSPPPPLHSLSGYMSCRPRLHTK